jgi:hypothetical protein
MPDIINSVIDEQAYTADIKGNLLSQVDKTIVCISSKGMHVAGFESNGKVLTIRCHGSDGTTDFFERRFGNEPLLSNTAKVAAVFVSSAKNLLIPKALYKEDTATQWLSDIHFIEKDEVIQNIVLRDDKAHFIYTLPSVMSELAQRYFPKAQILPFAAHQFNKNYKAVHILQCSITGNEAYLTLYKNKQLHWHKMMPYQTVEDVAYEIKLLCRQQDINDKQLPLICAIENPAQLKLTNELALYFPLLSIGTGKIVAEDVLWEGPVYLFQQLYSCVS